MKQSKLFGKTKKEIPKDEVSLNAQLLIRAGFIDKLTAGVYTYLPLGLMVLKKIQNIIREEMSAIDAQELLMPALTPKEIWMKTGRWTSLDVLFKLRGAGDKEYALGATHEEVITPLAQKFIFSYKDLPLGVYQIQDKFRDELRAKSGILRGREFNMKDLYSFHCSENDLNEYYEKAQGAYAKIFARCGLDAKLTEASGGTFSKYSHEYQVFCAAGEDIIKYCPQCAFTQNKEICNLQAGDKCPNCSGLIEEQNGVEVGNIFKLMTNYSAAFGFKVIDESGSEKDVLMGCYGIGPSRVMGTIVEVHHDDKGIAWPKEVAPFRVHLITLGESAAVVAAGEKIYEQLLKAGVAVLWDDRTETAGKKLNDCDLIGAPYRLVVSEKTLAKDGVELKERTSADAQIIDAGRILQFLK